MNIFSKCEYCKNDFIITPNHKRFCNRICSNKFTSEKNKGIKRSLETRKRQSDVKKGIKPTEETKRKMSASLSKRLIGNTINLGKKHSEETKKKMSETAKSNREKHHNWKGGITDINLKIRGSKELRDWRELVFKRDDYTCQKYKIKGEKLHAHHIVNFSTNINLRFSLENGITLSKKAHNEFHRKYGVKNNTLNQLLEFLND